MQRQFKLTLNVLITGFFICGAVGVASVCSSPALAVEPLHGRIEHMDRSRNGKMQEGEVASDAEAAANAQFDLAIQMATDAHLPASAKFSNYITMRSMLADFMVGKRRVVVMGPRISTPLQCRYFRLNPSTTKNWRGKYNPEWCKVKLQSTERGYYFTCAENPDGPRGWFLRVETPDGEKQRYAIFLDQPPQAL